MAFDKIQTQAIDVDTAPIKGSVNNSDYVLIRDVVTGDLQRILVSDLLAGSAGAIRLFGEADMENASTTPTSIVIDGDPNNATIEAGQAPVGVSPNGIAYIVKAPSGPVQTQISGATETVNDGDEIVWTGSKWSILAFGSDVTSVNGRTGDVTGLAEASNVYTKSESDAKYLPVGTTPTDIGAAEEGASPKWGTEMGIAKGAPYVPSGRVGASSDQDLNTIDGAGLFNRLSSNTAPNKPAGGSGYGYIQNWTYSSYAGGNVTQMYIPYGTPSGSGYLAFRTRYNDAWSDWNSVYSTNNKPTPSDIGAAAATDVYTKTETDNLLDNKFDKSGGAVSGSMTVSNIRLTGSGSSGYIQHVSGENALRGGGLSSATIVGNTSDNTYLDAKDGGIIVRDGTGELGKVFHEGFAPTAAQVGALPDTIALFSGNYADLQGIPTYFDTTWTRIDGKPSTFPPSVHNHDNLYYTKAEIDNAGYLLKTVADTEYAPISHNHDSLYYRKSEVDTKLGTKYDKSGGTINGVVNIIDSGPFAKLILRRTDLDCNVNIAFVNSNNEITYLGTTQDGNLAYGDNVDVNGTGSKIYSTTNKPTAADVGALTKAQADTYYLSSAGDLDRTGYQITASNMYASNFLNKDNAQQGIGMVAGGQTVIGGSGRGSSDIIFAPKGRSNASVGDNVMRLASDGTLNVQSLSASPEVISRVGAATNVNTVYRGLSSAGALIGSPVYAGMHSNGGGWAVGDAGDLSNANNRWLNVSSTGISTGIVNSTLVRDNGQRVYSPVNKPSPTELGVVASNIVTVTTQNWDSLVTSGDYPVSNATGANRPVISGDAAYNYGTLRVANTGSTIAQVYHEDNRGITYLRTKFSTNAWGTWKVIGGYNCSPMSAIPLEGTDLNTLVGDEYTDYGFFFQYANVNATAARHYPTQRAGSLIVQRSASLSGSGCTQLYITYDNGDMYVRTKYQSWSAWRKINMNTTYKGTSPTPPSGGVDGDIYIQY